MNRTSPPSTDENKKEKGESFAYLREILLGSKEPLAETKVCRWVRVKKNDAFVELPPSAECSPDKLDIALIVNDPASFDPKEYLSLFGGNAKRVHLCHTCHPDVMIDLRSEEKLTKVTSVWGLLLLGLGRNSKLVERRQEMSESVHQADSLMGTISFKTHSLLEEVPISDAPPLVALVFNILSLVVIALWLALKAHRRVLDYFARSGALLPMVAATGKGTFYGAVWVLTILRVFAFLGAGISATIFVFTELSESQGVSFGDSFLQGSYLHIAVWLFAICGTFGFATLIASVSDLRQRHDWWSALYMSLPLIVCGIGSLIWASLFLFDTPITGGIRNVIVSLPVIGMTPMVLTPLFQPPLYVLIIHGTLAFIGVGILAKKNANWFAAHLEDL